ncbi:MAG TPA: glutamate-cysteine ligase family protein [Polyangiaceae bacterium]|nr:glutamate-cysteine ligase family protein [Polyangiaceae bacterium]
MQSSPPSTNDAPLRSVEDLEQIFRNAEKPRDRFRIGAEAEKFGLDAVSLRPLQYSGQNSILSVFERLQRYYGWTPVSEALGSPVIALERGEASITLEPGAQLELSGAPWSDVHGIRAEFVDHFQELGAISRELGMCWLSVGFHPTASPDELPWVPKERYGIMQQYLPARGRRGRDMMQRTATVQANLDFASEEDAMRKLRAMLGLSPLFQAMCANSPFREGRVSELKSERLDVWLNMDPQRSGMLPSLWNIKRPRYRDYVEWALDAGMFFIKRGSRLLLNTGQSFRDFLRNGFEGQRATHADWFRHLSTLFPDVRLKSTLEIRTCDALPEDLTLAVPALFTGLLYDDRALTEVEELSRSVTLTAALACRSEVPKSGLAGQLGGKPLRGLAERVLEIGRGGLSRRGRLNAQGEDECIYLRPLVRLVEAGRCPADELRLGQKPGDLMDGRALGRVQVAKGLGG